MQIPAADRQSLVWSLHVAGEAMVLDADQRFHIFLLDVEAALVGSIYFTPLPYFTGHPSFFFPFFWVNENLGCSLCKL